MQRILILGCPGAGKSTVARRLEKETRLPLIHLDLLFHRPDHTTVPRAEFDARHLDALIQDRWIIDGNYMRTMPLRLKYCDTVFFLDFPAEVCLSGALERVGKQREDMPWIEEVPDPVFLESIREYPRAVRPRVLHLLEQYRPGRKILIFQSRAEMELFYVG